MNLFKYTYDLVSQIPHGMVSTYGAVARALGDIRASRAVGVMMKYNPDPINVPCYKIVHSDGSVGRYTNGFKKKIEKLKQDGIPIRNGRIENFEKYLFKDFKTVYPLKELRMEQKSLREKVVVSDSFSDVKTVAGFDVAYPRDPFDEAVAACVIFDYKRKKMLKKETIFSKSYFPYISTYLSYREFPLIEKLIEEISDMPSVLLVDGNGVLHPYGFGLASHVGVKTGLPSIGVAKKLLCGELRDQLVFVDDKKVGMAYFTSDKIKKPVFISPGHRVSLSTSVEIIRNLSIYKTPEPLRAAHVLAKETLKGSQVN